MGYFSKYAHYLCYTLPLWGYYYMLRPGVVMSVLVRNFRARM
jgi:hypothetical protein